MIVFLGGGESQIEMIMSLKAAGEKVCVVDMNCRCPASNAADWFVNESIYEGHAIAAAIHRLGILPTDGSLLIMTNTSAMTPVSTCLLAREIGAESFGIDGAQAACCKSYFKRRYNELFGTAHDFAVISADAFEWSSLANRFKDGMFIKPDSNRIGKTPCRVIRKPKGDHPPQLEFETSLNGKLVVEDYWMSGRDYVGLALVRRGEIISWGMAEELNMHDEGVSNIGFRTASESASALERSLRNVVTRLIEAFDIRNAPVAVTVRSRAGSDSFLPVELHLDFGGENIFLLPHRWTLAQLLKFWLSPPSGCCPMESSSELIHWSIYDGKVSNWDQIINSLSIEAGKQAASTGRLQWSFSLDRHGSKRLMEALGFHE